LGRVSCFGRIELIGVEMAKSILTGSSEVIRELRKYEPGLYKELRKSLNSELNPIIKPIQTEINSDVGNQLRSAMPGMFHSGRSSWSGANLSSRVSTNPKNLISITASGKSGRVGFNYAELAGIQRRKPRPLSRPYQRNGQTVRHRVNGQGLAFNEKLMREFGKPGRFAWIRVLRRKPEIEQRVLGIADRFGIALSRRLNS
jgi:hypothetical protein